jgi:hypothetical protein
MLGGSQPHPPDGPGCPESLPSNYGQTCSWTQPRNRGIAALHARTTLVVMMAGEEGIEPSLSRFWR